MSMLEEVENAQPRLNARNMMFDICNTYAMLASILFIESVEDQPKSFRTFHSVAQGKVVRRRRK